MRGHARQARDRAQGDGAIRVSGRPAALLRDGWHTENHPMAWQPALAHGAMVGAAGEGRFSSATRLDCAVAAAWVLAADSQAGEVHELAGDAAYTLAAFAAELSRQAGQSVACRDLSEADYRGVLVGAGLPDALADAPADADRAARRDTRNDGSGTRSRLIGRPTTPMRETIAGALG